MKAAKFAAAGSPGDPSSIAQEKGLRYRLFLCVFLLYLPFVYSTTWSENHATLRQTIALVDSGTLQVEKVGPLDSTERRPIRLSQFRVVGEGVYAKTSPGLSYFLVPVYFVLKPLLPQNERGRIFLLNFFLAVFLGAPLGALTIVLFYDVMRARGSAVFDSLFLSLGLAFATNHFPFSLALKQRSIVEFLIILVLWMQLAHHHEKTGLQSGRLLTTGIVIGLIPITNYSGIIYWPALFLYLFNLYGWREPVKIGLIACLMQLLSFAHTYAIFGRLGSNIYDNDFPLMLHTFGTFVIKAFNLLLSPTQGSLLYTPVLLLGLYGLVRALRSPAGRRDPAMQMIAVCFVTHWIFFSWWLGPTIHSGGEAISGRFMVPIIPLLLMAAPRFNEARTAWRILFLLSSISAYASAQAGTIYHAVIALIYTLKVAVSSWGMPVIFSEYLPSLLGVRTFHTVLVLPSVTFESLTTGIAGISLTKLLLNQTPFFILFLISLIPGIWMLRGIVKTMKMPKA